MFPAKWGYIDQDSGFTIRLRGWGKDSTDMLVTASPAHSVPVDMSALKIGICSNTLHTVIDRVVVLYLSKTDDAVFSDSRLCCGILASCTAQQLGSGHGSRKVRRWEDFHDVWDSGLLCSSP